MGGALKKLSLKQTNPPTVSCIAPPSPSPVAHPTLIATSFITPSPPHSTCQLTGTGRAGQSVPTHHIIQNCGPSSTHPDHWSDGSHIAKFWSFWFLLISGLLSASQCIFLLLLWNMIASQGSLVGNGCWVPIIHGQWSPLLMDLKTKYWSPFIRTPWLVHFLTYFEHPKYVIFFFFLKD